MVMTMRKMTVTISSSVRTQAGGGGIACGADDVESLRLVTLRVVDVLGPAKVGGDRDILWGLARCLRGRIGAEMGRGGRETGRQ